MANEEFDLENDVIELVDDDGNVIKFKLLDITEFKGEKYTLLIPAEENEEVAEDEVLIFRLNEEKETLDVLEDEALLDEIFNHYLEETEGEDVYQDEE